MNGKWLNRYHKFAVWLREHSFFLFQICRFIVKFLRFFRSLLYKIQLFRKKVIKQNNHQSAKIFNRNFRSDVGLFMAVCYIGQELYRYRSSIWVVFKQQFMSSYSGSVLGSFWNFALPIVPISVYIFLAKVRVFPNFNGVDSAPFIAFGVTLWLFYAGCILVPIQTIASKNREVVRTEFSLGANIASAFSRLAFETIVRFAFVLFIALVYQSWPTANSFSVIIMVVLAVILFVSVGLIFGLVNLVYKDVSKLVTVALQYGIFVSGIIFPVDQIEVLSIINQYNPFYIYIKIARDAVFYGYFPINVATSVLIVISIAVALVSAKIFYSTEYRLRELG